MSILINLLPDIRQAKLRERHRRQLFTGISLVVWAVCGGIVVLLGIYTAGETVVIHSLSSKITSRENQLEGISGLTTALTAEQHLASLPSLYEQRVYLSQFFKAYTSADPSSVSLNALTIDSSNNVTVTGTASTYTAVATLARAMEDSNVNFGTGASSSNTPYFTDVNIVNSGSSSAGISFTIEAVIGAEVVSGSN